jgi:hypothetical protein
VFLNNLVILITSNTYQMLQILTNLMLHVKELPGPSLYHGNLCNYYCWLTASRMTFNVLVVAVLFLLDHLPAHCWLNHLPANRLVHLPGQKSTRGWFDRSQKEAISITCSFCHVRYVRNSHVEVVDFSRTN